MMSSISNSECQAAIRQFWLRLPTSPKYSKLKVADSVCIKDEQQSMASSKRKIQRHRHCQTSSGSTSSPPRWLAARLKTIKSRVSTGCTSYTRRVSMEFWQMKWALGKRSSQSLFLRRSKARSHARRFITEVRTTSSWCQRWRSASGAKRSKSGSRRRVSSHFMDPRKNAKE